MLKVFRLASLLLLALTVPLQGMAAVLAGQCKVLEHHQEGTTDGPAHAHDGGYEGAAHTHDAGDGVKQDNHGKNAHCGPCTACCASASIASAEALPFLTLPAAVTYTFSQFPPLGIEPDGLDRPPLAL